MFDFSSLSLPINGVVFSVGAVLGWLAGTKPSKYVDLFADRTGLGKAFGGPLRRKLRQLQTAIALIATTANTA